MRPSKHWAKQQMANPNKPKAVSFIAELGLVFTSITMLSWLLVTFVGRVGHPYDLEWMEGGMLVHGHRVLNGEGLYVSPSLDFIPYIYPPLYSWLLAALGAFFGLDYGVGRSISLLSTLLAAAAIVKALRLEKARWGVCAVAVTVFLSAYDEVGSFFDLVRADGLLIALLGWALVAVRHGSLRSGGLLLFAAFLCKHNAAIFGLPCVWWLLKEHNWTAAVQFALWSAIPALVMTVALQISTGGYFLTYLLGVPGGHPIVAYRFIWWTARELTEVAPALVGCGVLWLLWQLFSQRQRLNLAALMMSIGLGLTALWIESRPHNALWGSRHNAVLPYVIPMWIGVVFALRKLVSFRGTNGFWVLNGVVAISFSALMRGHHGGFINVLIPGVWALSIWIGLLCQRLWKGERGAAFVLALGMVQLFYGRWDPAHFLPTERDLHVGDALVEEIKAIDGEVFIPHSPWLAVQAGKSPSAHLIAVWDIDHQRGPLVESMSALKDRIASRHYAAIITAKQKDFLGHKQHYRRSKTLRRGRAMVPKVGWKVAPTYLYVPK